MAQEKEEELKRQQLNVSLEESIAKVQIEMKEEREKEEAAICEKEVRRHAAAQGSFQGGIALTPTTIANLNPIRASANS